MTSDILLVMERRKTLRRCKGSKPGTFVMKRSILVLAATALGALSLSACDDRRSSDYDDDRTPPVDVAPPEPAPPERPVETPPVTDPVPTPPPEKLKPDERGSEQSVQPDSETLFY